MARSCAVLVVAAAMLVGAEGRAADPMSTEVLRVEREARQSLKRVGSRQPLARRCLQALSRRATRLAARVRTARTAGARSWSQTVTLTRAYVEAVILGGELRRCRELVGLTEVRSGTRVRVEIDPSLAATDPTEPGWLRR